VHLDALAADRGVRAFSLHPGGIMTPLQRHLPRAEMVALGWLDDDGNPTPEAAANFKTPEQGAATEVWAATSPQLAGRGGLYLEDCEVAKVAPEAGARGVRDYAVDPDAAARLWAISAERTGVDAFA
jgi:NAD(P)-dependent dehydrogenase (short-subunit alcohol dehydrogenase family)